MLRAFGHILAMKSRRARRAGALRRPGLLFPLSKQDLTKRPNISADIAFKLNNYALSVSEAVTIVVERPAARVTDRCKTRIFMSHLVQISTDCCEQP